MTGKTLSTTHGVEVKAISDEDFRLLDYEVMGLAFSIHRELGRFWNETIYQNELAAHYQKAGFEKVATKVLSEWPKMTNLEKEWGAFLGTSLFNEAIYHFCDGDENAARKIAIKNDSNIPGRQKVHLINSEVVFTISSITKGETFYEQDLRRCIRFASLKAMQWSNFNHN
ncbi:MAG: hypothetical protein ACE5HS_16850 [bacterium]